MCGLLLEKQLSWKSLLCLHVRLCSSAEFPSGDLSLVNISFETLAPSPCVLVLCSGNGIESRERL